MLNIIGWARIYLFVFVSVLYVFMCFICPGRQLNLGNTVNLEYLNQIPNPEYLTGANVPKQRLIVFLKFSIRFLQKIFLQKIGA